MFHKEYLNNFHCIRCQQTLDSPNIILEMSFLRWTYFEIKHDVRTSTPIADIK